MRIGEVARLAGTTTKATRFYESVGLLPPPGRAENGYRDYTPADAERLRLLVGLRSLDVPLERAYRSSCATSSPSSGPRLDARSPS